MVGGPPPEPPRMSRFSMSNITWVWPNLPLGFGPPKNKYASTISNYKKKKTKIESINSNNDLCKIEVSVFFM